MDGSWQVACLQRNFHVTNPLSHFRYIRTTTFLGKINNRVRLSGLGSSHHNSLLINWLQSFFNDESLIAKTLIILYHIWKARNHLIFRNIDPNPIRIAFSAANMFLNYSADIPKKNTNQIHSSLIKWKCPPPGMIKLNFDGSVKLNSSASAGFILRNSSGTPILASAKSLGKSSIIVAEAMALRAGLQACLFHNHTQIEAEGDSKILIDCINKKIGIPWKIKPIIEDIWSLVPYFSSISFHHVWREANFAADAIADSVFDDGQALSWSTSYPVSVRNAIVFDLVNSGCFRGFCL